MTDNIMQEWNDRIDCIVIELTNTVRPDPVLDGLIDALIATTRQAAVYHVQEELYSSGKNPAVEAGMRELVRHEYFYVTKVVDGETFGLFTDDEFLGGVC